MFCIIFGDPQKEKDRPSLLMCIIYFRKLCNVDFGNKIEVARMKAEKEESFIEELVQIKNSVPEKLKKCIDLACEKGAGVWLTALPLQNMGYVLNKQEFRDAVCLRYEWKNSQHPLIL